ncbi:MAG: hypothetical protein CTY23_06405 [Methylomonas sp.]|nr:MAG: hypothetical protein CTY23_06405 [Methylomonas sp.]
MKLSHSMFATSAAVRLEIEPTVLASLMEKGLLHATDFRCLDKGSKRIVWAMLLSLMSNRLGDKKACQRNAPSNHNENLGTELSRR